MEHYPYFVFDEEKVESKRVEDIFILNTKSKIPRSISPLNLEYIFQILYRKS